MNWNRKWQEKLFASMWKVASRWSTGNPCLRSSPHGSRESKLENRKSKLENRKPKIEIRKSKMENGNSKLEDGALRRSLVASYGLQSSMLRGPRRIGKKMHQFRVSIFQFRFSNFDLPVSIFDFRFSSFAVCGPQCLGRS